ncbi:MAG TPA: peptidoglycan DD-metalloendopeptidase family protein [Nitratidesulfovibrio sp.]|nr:peptidoglycan DD-metalloendopeptidase family protein [Nitratidesulfovibrio sp.]
MTAPVDPKLATATAAQHELTQRKLEMDALRKNLRNDPSKEQKLRQACEGFESIFVQKMWEQMRATLPKEGYLHSKEEEFWQSMYDQELAKKMTSAGGIGLADMIYEQLSTRLTDTSRTTAPSSVREPVPVKPVSLVPRTVTPASASVKGAAPSSMYEPASPEAPVASEGPAPEGAVSAGSASAGHVPEGSAAGHDIVQQHLAELERQVAAAPVSAAPPVAAAGASAIPAAGGVAVSTAAPSTASAVAPAEAVQAAQAAAAPASASQGHGTRGLPAAAVPGGNTRKVRSPMRDAQKGPPIVHRTNAMKRVASPSATRVLSVPSGAPTAAEMQAGAAVQAAQAAQDAVSGVAPASAAPAAGQTSALPTAAPQADPASTTAAPKPSPTGGPAVALGTPGSMTWPHEGRIASGFGWRNDPITGERAWHPGVDIAVTEGDPVRAAWDGKVVFAGERADYGKLVVLEHPGGWRSFYGHNGSLDVREGDTVRAGTEIAKAGGTGRVAGPHLHFEVRQGELAVNPEYAARSLASGGPAAQRTRPGG